MTNSILQNSTQYFEYLEVPFLRIEDVSDCSLDLKYKFDKSRAERDRSSSWEVLGVPGKFGLANPSLLATF